MSAVQELPPSPDDAIEPVLTRRKLEEADMDITPMIDMTFLLLIFFIVSSKMGPKAGVELPLARHGDAVVQKKAVILTVGPGDSMARVYRGESVEAKDAFTAASPDDQEAEIIAYIEQEMSSPPPGQPAKELVLIQAAKGLKHRDVARVAKAAARAEVEKLYIGVMEKK